MFPKLRPPHGAAPFGRTACTVRAQPRGTLRKTPPLQRLATRRISGGLDGRKTRNLAEDIKLYESRIKYERTVAEIATEPTPVYTMKRLTEAPTTPQELLLRGKTAHRDMLILIAQRITALRSLPFVFVLNPHISKIYKLYINTFRILYKFDFTKSSNSRFVAILEKLVEAHDDILPIISKGFTEGTDQGYITAQECADFLNFQVRERIVTRLIAKHHIALTKGIPDVDDPQNWTGILKRNLKVSELVAQCAEFVGGMCDLKYGARVPVVVDAGSNVSVTYVPYMLEYIITEALKNSSRAVIENNENQRQRDEHWFGHEYEPIVVTIVEGKRTADGYRSVGIRVRDEGGGIPERFLDRLFEFAFTSVEPESDDATKTPNAAPDESANTVAGMGYGLPLSR